MCGADNEARAQPPAAQGDQQQADAARFTESLLPDWTAAASGPYHGAMLPALPQSGPPGTYPTPSHCCPFVGIPVLVVKFLACQA